MGQGPLKKAEGENDVPGDLSTSRLKMMVPVMTKPRSLKVMGTKMRRRKTPRKKPKR